MDKNASSLAGPQICLCQPAIQTTSVRAHAHTNLEKYRRHQMSVFLSLSGHDVGAVLHHHSVYQSTRTRAWICRRVHAQNVPSVTEGNPIQTFFLSFSCSPSLCLHRRLDVSKTFTRGVSAPVHVYRQLSNTRTSTRSSYSLKRNACTYLACPSASLCMCGWMCR